MKNFDDIQHVWQQQPLAEREGIDALAINKLPAGIKEKLLRQQATGITVLFAIIILIAYVGLFSTFFKRTLTYIGLLVALGVIVMQLVVMVYTYIKIKKINDTLVPVMHLQQWESYYVFRKKQVRWNMPAYFILLNLAMCLYLAEAVVDHFNVWVGIFLAVYIVFMLFTYFVLEKMALAREEKRIQQIIDYLKKHAQQLKEE